MSTSTPLRPWVCAMALATASFASAQSQPKVTMTMPSTKASNVTKEIQRQTGVSVVCNPTVGSIPILVSVTDVPLDELLVKIAAVTGGEVYKQGEGYLLSKSDKVRTEQANKETKWVVEAFDRAKKRMIGDNSVPDRWDQKTLDEQVAKAQAARERMNERISNVERQRGAQISMFDSSLSIMTPANGAAKRAIELLPASVLASIKPGDRVVYSTSPNRMQTRMPFNVTSIVNDFVYNHNLLARSAPQLREDQNVRIIGGLASGQPIQGVVETHLILSRGYRSSTIQAEIKFVDREGLYVGQATRSITPEYLAVQPATSEEGKTVTISDLSRQMAILMAQEIDAASSDRNIVRIASAGGGGNALIVLDNTDGSLPKMIPDELLNVLVNPDKYDPTSLYVSECYIQAAKAEGKNLVASFPDAIVKNLAKLLVKGNVTHKAILAGSPALEVTVVSESDWMTVTPTLANAARETLFNRDASAKLFRATNGRGFATLEELADYSFHVTTGMPDRPLDMVYLSLISKSVADQLNEYISMNLDLLRLYGTVPENIKRQGGEHVSLTYRTLTPQGKELAARSYYNRSTGFSMPQVAEGQSSVAIFMTQETGSRANRPAANSIMSEPTEALPNGIPSEAVVTIDRSLQEGVFATTKGIRGGQMLSAQELGMRQGMLEANRFGGGTQIQFDTYQPSQVVSVTVTLQLGDYGTPSANFKDAWLVQNSRAVAYDWLPEGFRAKVDEAKQQLMVPPAVRTTGRTGGGGGV